MKWHWHIESINHRLHDWAHWDICTVLTTLMSGTCMNNSANAAQIFISLIWLRHEDEWVYHGTATMALEAIEASGAIKKMKRHAVHMQADINKAWQSAERWHKTPVVLKISASTMAKDGYTFGVTENEVWCTEELPVKYICDRVYKELLW